MMDLKVRGDKELGAAMIEMGRQLGLDMKKTVPIAAYKASLQGRNLSKPGAQLRRIIRRGRPPQDKKIHKRTDTSRYSTHWVEFLRQGKKPYYVPVNPNPHSVNFAKPDPEKHGRERYNEWMQARRARAKTSTPSVYKHKYQQTRNSTRLNSRNNIMKYDTPKEIRSMRKIGRRGLAKESWGWMGNQTGGGRKIALKDKADGVGRVTKKSRPAIESHAKKWTRVKKNLQDYRSSVLLDNRLSYLSKSYPGLESQIMRDTARSLPGEVKRRLVARAKALEKKKMRTAA